ncbi:MAG: NAD-dependent epimerase/dehydratase family protein [Bacteroidia bacterium]
MSKLHTIIGAGGSIGSNLTNVLVQAGEQVRIISRSGKKQEGCESAKANALEKEELRAALKGSSIAYLLIGIEYKSSVWESNWPVIMQNTLDICSEENIPFIFFDNVYMYGLVDGKMTESTPFKPISRKGRLRAKIASSLLEAISEGKVKAMIARSADFYGPYSEKLSFFHAMVIKNLMEGKKPQWMLNDSLPHSLTFTPDAGKALYMLSKDESCWNQTWHMPTAYPPKTGTELMNLSAKALDQQKNGMILPKWMLKLLGFFIPAIAENMEMLYQVSEPYIFSSEKFEKHFNFSPTSYEEGIKKSIQHAMNMKNA